MARRQGAAAAAREQAKTAAGLKPGQFLHGDFDADYDEVLRGIQSAFIEATANNEPLFMVEPAGDLLDGLLIEAGLPARDRQHFSCSCCRSFLNYYGRLVTIDRETGALRAVMANKGLAGRFALPMRALAKRVESRAVKTPFVERPALFWGRPQTGVWRHMNVGTKAAYNWNKPRETAGQRRAKLREDYKDLRRALGDFSLATAQRALDLLSTDQLFRGDKFIPVAAWFLNLRAQDERTRTRRAGSGRLFDNLCWWSVATAPAGWAQVRSSMIGTLLEDLESGTSVEGAKARFGAKMAYTAYMRPLAPPRAGQIAVAEQLVADLKLEPALHRRIARLAEVPKLWVPPTANKDKPDESVFGYLSAPNVPVGTATIGGPMTWVKFAAKILPLARVVLVHVADNANPLMALTTAVNPDAPCILQWDDDFARNPVAGYSYPSGSPAAAWNLPRGWHPVSAIVNAPWNWSNNAAKFKSRGDYVVLVIPNARECRSPGLALFPEDLRSELHPVRAVIEAHSARTPMQGQDDGDCCGIGLGSQSRVVRAGVRVLIGTDWTEYIIDRWE